MVSSVAICYNTYSIKQDNTSSFLVVNNQTQKAVMLHSINGVGQILHLS